jgi:hypothetical protein
MTRDQLKQLEADLCSAADDLPDSQLPITLGILVRDGLANQRGVHFFAVGLFCFNSSNQFNTTLSCVTDAARI